MAEARDVPGWGTTGDIRSSRPVAITTHLGFDYPTRPELAPIFGELDLDDLLAEDA